MASALAGLNDMMAKAEGIAAVLHISAVTSVLCLAYLRLDHDHSADQDARAEQEAAEQNEAAEAFSGLEINPDTFHKLVRFGRIRMTHPVYVITVMAGIKVTVKLRWRLWFYLSRQRRIPLFVFYRNRHHLHLVTLSAVVSLAALFLYGFGAILHWHWIQSTGVQIGVTFALLSCLFVVLLMSVGSTWQQPKRRKKTLRKMVALHQKRVQDWQEEQAADRDLVRPSREEQPWGLPPQTPAGASRSTGGRRPKSTDERSRPVRGRASAKSARSPKVSPAAPSHSEPKGVVKKTREPPAPKAQAKGPAERTTGARRKAASEPNPPQKPKSRN